MKGDTVPPAANDIDEETQRSLKIVICLVTEGRKLFRTDSGGLGLGPGSIQVGDEVHAIPGGKVQYLLRRREDNSGSCPIYGLVGDCHWDQVHVPVLTELTPVAERPQVCGGIPRLLLDTMRRIEGGVVSVLGDVSGAAEDQRRTIMIR